MTRKNYRVSYDFRPAVEGAAVAGGLLLAAHIGLYRFRGVLPRPAAYAVGVAALGLGLAHAAAEREDMTAVADGALITVVGGALVAGAHAVRWLLFQRQEARRDPIPRIAFVGGA